MPLKIDPRNSQVLTRNGQPANQRLNNIIDRYSFIVDTQRARVLSMFGEDERRDLTLALKPLEASRGNSLDIKRRWLVGLPKVCEARDLLTEMSPIDTIVLLEALEGATVDLN